MMRLSRLRQLLAEDQLLAEESALIYGIAEASPPFLITEDRHLHDLLLSSKSQRKQWADIVIMRRKYSHSLSYCYE